MCSPEVQERPQAHTLECSSLPGEDKLVQEPPLQMSKIPLTLTYVSALIRFTLFFLLDKGCWVGDIPNEGGGGNAPPSTLIF